MNVCGTVVLKPGKERKVKNFYPWIQQGEVQAVNGKIEDGELARLESEEGEFLGIGTWNSQSRFRFRVLSRDDEPIDQAFFAKKLSKSVGLRQRLVTDTNARRIVYSESDGLPGIIVDDYDGHVVVQVRSLGMERLKDRWLPALVEATNAKSVYERSEMAGREEEGLGPFAGQLHGDTPEEVEIEENGLKFIVPVRKGLKTGFYLDQRATRRTLAAAIKPGESVLDAFCYSGAFSMYATSVGAKSVGVDINAGSIEVAKRNAKLNNSDATFVEANVFDWLENTPPQGFNWVVLDPPAIAKTATNRDSLKWAIWKLVHRSIPHLAPEGRMIVCSCSYQLDRRELVETARLAASDQGVRLFLEEVTFQDRDHPVLIHVGSSRVDLQACKLEYSIVSPK